MMKGLLDKLQWFATGTLFLALGLCSRTIAAQPLKPPPSTPDHDPGLQKAAVMSEAITRKMPAMSQSRPKVLKFYADWCEKCKEFNPIIETARTKYEDRVDFLFVNIDDPSNKGLVEKYQVKNLPTTIYLDKDGDEVGTMIGYVGSNQVNWAMNMLVMDGQQASIGLPENSPL